MLKLMLCSSRPDPGSLSCFLRLSLVLQSFLGPKHKAKACAAYKNNVCCATSCCGARVGTAVTGRQGRHTPPSSTFLEGRLAPLKCEGLHPLPLYWIWATLL